MTQRVNTPATETCAEKVLRSNAPGEIVHLYFGGGRAVFFNVFRPNYMPAGMVMDLQAAGTAE